MSTSTPLTIGHLVESLEDHGVAAALGDLAAAGPDAGFRVVLVALAPSGHSAVADRVARAGVAPVELNVAPWDPRAVTKVLAVFRAHGVDLVHTHGARPDVVGSAAAARLRVPAVSTLHHIHEHPADRGDQLRRTARTMARKRFMTRTIATSVLQRDWYRRAAGSTEGLSVIPDGAADPGEGTVQERLRLRHGLGVDENEVVAVSVAPMRRGRGQDLLLDAVAEIGPDEPLTVVLGGDGPLRPWLESRVAADDALSGRVAFRRSADPVELLRAADVQLHTTRHDTMPRMLLLGQGTATPAVATRVGGIPEIVTRDTGALTPVDATRIADELVRLVRDPDLRARRGAAARARFLQRFESSVWAASLGDVYRSAAGVAGAPAPAELDTPEPVGRG
ncbi:glycosyltransferase family 4 protein [Pseudonocardia spirodelae]|uniref:Glycosyltransferase family 4 protein n=1 Tax=Pseudonocardia spirodelae TaxID=3133431 RepID=A0ABU8T7C9_9PSEU